MELSATRRCNLYWVLLGEKRQYITVGAFDTAPSTAPAKKRRVGDVRMIRVRVAAQSPEYNTMAVIWETVRGELLPRPVPVEQTEVMRAT